MTNFRTNLQIRSRSASVASRSRRLISFSSKFRSISISASILPQKSLLFFVYYCR
nr:MAG TPA: hypothetical protein [Caudoviricetes sp.]DAH69714.1 MAG TPA: hypothetical protein [Caudoviricetes sp.]DAO00182.1 MAG TPA: hypothetical protein [Caudoviricetes sp.]DAZ13517.1 MAG TPA: hypothetical protein [Caudoviricetes sp.]